jgi:hypothetical protein
MNCVSGCTIYVDSPIFALFLIEIRRITLLKNIGPCHVSGIFLPLRVNSLPLATIYEVKIPLRKWKKSLLQRNPAQMTWHIITLHMHIWLFTPHLTVKKVHQKKVLVPKKYTNT